MNVTTVTIQGCHSQMRYTPTLFQYDYGQILKIEGVELPETFQAHFCNVSDSSTKTVLGSDNQVSIPDEYLDTGEDILCYIYLHTGEEDGETEYKIFIPVTARQSITDEEPTPEEQSVIDQLVSALNSGVARAETAATNAETSEVNAKASEDNAKASEEAALQAKDDAETAKTEAEEAEANATQKATDAEGSANRASASATLSESWAVGGTNTRQGEDTNNAKYYAESTISAKDAAVLAKTQAESARDLAVQAKDSAQASAQTATQKASEASQSATSASQSASSAQAFATGASQSATSAESAKTAAETAQGLAEDARDEAVTAKDEAETAQQEAESAAQSIAQSASQIAQNTNDISDLKSAVNQMYPTDTASGAIASFPDGAKDVPVDSLIVNIEPVQEGTGDPSPDNIRPISGHEEVSVVRCGKNLFDGTFVNMAVASFVDGTIVAEQNSYRGFYVRAVGGNSYTISRTTIETNRFRIAATVEEPAAFVPAIWLAQLASQDSGYSVTVTLPEGYNYIFVYLSNQSDTCTVNNYQVQLGSTATAYEPYQSETYTIELGDTIYGGTLDVTKGELTVDRAMVDLGSLSWSARASGEQNALYSSSLPQEYVPDYSLLRGWICDTYVENSPSSAAILQRNVDSMAIGLYSYRSTGAKSTTFYLITPKTASPQGTLVYELATPITIPLTPQQISTLYGTNNFFADTGDTNVTYKADIQLYIQKKISAAVAALS